jgi:predicted Kef-type K+ transport protein
LLVEDITIAAIFPLALAIAFLLGFGARLIGLPALVGFLVAGFVLNALGVEDDETLKRVGDFGVTLLLFTIGLKLKVKNLARPEVWGGASLHALITTVLFSLVFYGLAIAGAPLFAGLDLGGLLLVAFAASFSSTVFAVKVLEEKGELSSLHGRTAIGILIMQDVFAVIFLTVSTGKIPSVWAIPLLIALFLLRPVMAWILDRVGHGELLPIFAMFTAVALGARAFEVVNLKPDLGALIIGMLLASHKRASELADTLFGLKELLLVGFFLSVGLKGLPNLEQLFVALILMLLLPFKSWLFFWLLVRFNLRARSASLAAFSLSNYSEFGLIVAALAVANGWMGPEWLVAMAISLAISFIFAAPLNAKAHSLCRRYHDWLKRFETPKLHPEEVPLDVSDARVLIFGVGRIGTAAYDQVVAKHGPVVAGVESNAERVRIHREAGRRVVQGDAIDPDFWERLRRGGSGDVEVVMLAMPEHRANLFAVKQIRASGFTGFVAALSEHADQARALEEAGANLARNLAAEAGAGFASDVADRVQSLPHPSSA